MTLNKAYQGEKIIFFSKKIFFNIFKKANPWTDNGYYCMDGLRWDNPE